MSYTIEEVLKMIDEDDRAAEKAIRKTRQIATKMRKEILERDNYTCKACGKNGRFYPTEMEVDHIKPVSKGGKSDQDNLQTLCISCNRKKHAKYS